jgi:anti-anti-sigma factor
VLDFSDGGFAMTVSHFEILERQDDDALRLLLTGELDLVSTPELEERLSQLRAEKLAVRLDLSKLEFIDSTGLHVLIKAIKDAQSDDWLLRIDPEMAPQVMHLCELVHLDRLIPGYERGRT